jgi:hypothetical protein
LGLQTAWPYIDDYLDFSSLDSLRGLVERVEARVTAGIRTPPPARGDREVS